MITSELKRQLATQASKLNPIILIGNKGLTEAVHLEIERALHDHELIKIRFHSKDREDKKEMTDLICQRHQATLINKIGHVITIYKPRLE